MASTTIPPEQCAAVVLERVPVVMRFLRTEMRRHGAHGLSMPQFRALAFVSRSPGTSLSAVAEFLGVTLSTASIIADRLVRQGLVERAPHPTERRKITLTITEAGSELYQQARTATRERLARVLKGLSSGQLGAIVEGVSLVSDAINEANPGAAAERSF